MMKSGEMVDAPGEGIAMHHPIQTQAAPIVQNQDITGIEVPCWNKNGPTLRKAGRQACMDRAEALN